MNTRDLLEEEIIASANEGDTTVLAELLNMLDDKVIYNALSDEGQQAVEDAKPYYKLKGGEYIKAKVDMVGCDDSYNMPSSINIPKGTVVIVPSEATRMGDLFTSLNSLASKDSLVIKDCRYTNKGVEMKYDSRIGLTSRSGYEMGGGPHILGSILKSHWEVL